MKNKKIFTPISNDNLNGKFKLTMVNHKNEPAKKLIESTLVEFNSIDRTFRNDFQISKIKRHKM